MKYKYDIVISTEAESKRVKWLIIAFHFGVVEQIIIK